MSEIREIRAADVPHIIPENPEHGRDGERRRRLRGQLRVARNRDDEVEVARIELLLGESKGGWRWILGKSGVRELVRR